MDVADLADKVRRSVLPRYGQWQDADWQDAGQEVALKIWIEYSIRPDKGEAYYFTAGSSGPEGRHYPTPQ
jgi:hypothetical protein